MPIASSAATAASQALGSASALQVATAASNALPPASAASSAPDWWTQGSLSFELVKGMPAVAVALFIGLCTLWVAVEQWRVARDQAKVANAKLNFDLFSERIGLLFLPAAAKAHFLFGDEIGNYFDDVARRNRAYGMAKGGNERATSEAFQRFMSETDLWFTAEQETLRERFRNHLDFSNWRPPGA